jgi:protein TonB
MKKRIILNLLMFIPIIALAQKNPSEYKSYDEYADIPPIARGCDSNASINEIRNCFNKSVTQQIVNNLNTNVFKRSSLKKGNYRIIVNFTISETGELTNINSEFEDQKITKAFIKAVSKVKKMTPGYLDDQPVPINYSIPMTFAIE